jgi:hypothetical protein
MEKSTEENLQTKGHRQSMSNVLPFFYVKTRSNKQKKNCWFLVIMVAQNEEEITLEQNIDKGHPKEPGHNNEGSSSTKKYNITTTCIKYIIKHIR